MDFSRIFEVLGFYRNFSWFYFTNLMQCGFLMHRLSGPKNRITRVFNRVFSTSICQQISRKFWNLSPPNRRPMSFTDNPIVWLMNEIPHMLSKTKMLKCFFKYFSTHCAAMYAAEKMLPLLPNKAISKHVWVELIHFQILYGHELITFSCLSHFIFNYLPISISSGHGALTRSNPFYLS